MPAEFHATTILAVKRNGHVTMAGDGQVTLGQTMVMKHTAKKIRLVGDGKVLAGFAGATADAFTLFELFEAKLKEFHGNLVRAAVEMTKQWRRDKYLQKLEAMLLLADREHILLLSGTGYCAQRHDHCQRNLRLHKQQLYCANALAFCLCKGEGHGHRGSFRHRGTQH